MKLLEAVKDLRAKGYIDVAAGNDKGNRISIDDYIGDLESVEEDDINNTMDVIADEDTDGTAEIVMMENGYRQGIWLYAYMYSNAEQTLRNALQREDIEPVNGEDLEERLLRHLQLKYVGKKISLNTLDGEICEMLGLTDSESIYNYDAREMIEDGFCYQYTERDDPQGPAGYDFSFEIAEDNEDVTKIIVKVTDIETV